MGNWGPAEWSAVGDVATAFIALVAVIYAALQVGEAKKAREAQAQPFVVVSLEPSPVAKFIIELVVENIGSTLARDVSFKFDPPLKSSLDDSELEHSYLVQQGIPTMPPKMRLARVFDSAIQRQEVGDLPWRFDVEVRFSDHRGKEQEKLRYVLDLEPYRSGTYLEERSLHHAAKALEEIRSVLKTSTHADSDSESRSTTRTIRNGQTDGSENVAGGHLLSRFPGQLAADPRGSCVRSGR